MAIRPEQRLNPEDRANLVAYLDGELTEAESRAIATKLTQSATARREADSLRKAWELLEYLPRPAASEAFTERTQSAIRKLESRDGAWKEASAPWLRAGTRAVVMLAAGAGLMAAGFALARWVWPDPMIRMARDLSLAEHLNEYREVGTFGFLEQLVNSKEFGSPTR